MGTQESLLVFLGGGVSLEWAFLTIVRGWKNI